MLREHSGLEADPHDIELETYKVRSDGLRIDTDLAFAHNAAIAIDYTQIHRTGRYIQANVMLFCHRRVPQLNIRQSL